MVSLLSKFFIKNNTDYKDVRVRRLYGMLCGALGIFFNLLLFAGKFLAGKLSGSIAVTADAFNNLSDAGSSIITLAGFKLAGQKPDTHHPFGHGRIEYISGLFVSLIILVMGFELLKTSFDKILHPEAMEFSIITVAILAASILVKGYMYLYNRAVSTKISSATMRATATDSISDCCSTFAVLVSTLVSNFGGINIDGWCGLAVAAFILYSGLKSAKETISPLLGQPPEAELVEEIERIVMSHEGVVGVHDLIVHDYGPGRCMISLHAEVPADADILVMHDTIDNAEQQLRDRLDCQAIIHMDPISIDDEDTNRMKAKICELLEIVEPRFSIHDFRLVKGPTHTNVIFDIAVPYDVKMSDDEVRDVVTKLVKTIDKSINCVLEIDRLYVEKTK